MPTGISASMVQFGSIILLIVVFYLLLIRPQQKQQKKTKQMLANLKVGDRVKTIGGLYGRISRIKDDVVYIEVGTNKVELVYARNAISVVETSDAETELDKPDTK